METFKFTMHAPQTLYLEAGPRNLLFIWTNNSFQSGYLREKLVREDVKI